MSVSDGTTNSGERMGKEGGRDLVKMGERCKGGGRGGKGVGVRERKGRHIVDRGCEGSRGSQ